MSSVKQLWQRPIARAITGNVIAADLPPIRCGDTSVFYRQGSVRRPQI